MKRKEIFIVIAILIIESIFQITGSLFYDVYPAWLWTLCDASMIMIPLMFGLKIGLIGCIPNIVSEIIWFVTTGYIGTLLHGIAFLIVVTILGLIKAAANNRPMKWAVPIKIISYEIFLIMEELIYVLLRIACGASNASYLTWKRISVDFLSIGNIICLALGVVYFIFLDKE